MTTPNEAYGGETRWRPIQVSFKGYAVWNYLAFPAFLFRPEIDWEEPQPGLVDILFEGMEVSE